MPNRFRLSSLITAASLLSGCLQPTVPPATPLPTSIAESNAPVEWETLAPGLERRTLSPSLLAPFTVLRIDPAVYTFRVHYRPGEPLTVSEWAQLIPDAVVFVNANFFDRQNHVLGLLISDGIAYGTAYSDRGGMLMVEGDSVGIRSTITEPYQGEAFDQVVQAFPMLVTDGIGSFTSNQADRASRRTVIGQDSAGRILLIVSTSLFGMRLTELSAYLPTTGLDLVNAFNLDGGASTMLNLNMGVNSMQIPSFDPVPAVLAVYPRMP